MSNIIYQVRKEVDVINPLTPYRVSFKIEVEDENLLKKLINYAELFPYSIRPCYTFFNKLCIEFSLPSWATQKLDHNLKDYLIQETIFKFETKKEMNYFHANVSTVVHLKINKLEESYRESVKCGNDLSLRR